MSTTSLISSSRRPLQLRMRADLQARRQAHQGREYWVVKDPLALKYFRFEEEEFAILQMLDGQVTLEQIQQRFETQFAPQKISSAELHHLLGMLFRSGLVISDAPGQGEQLAARQRERAGQERLAQLTNLLALRFRGVDPDRWLTWLERRVGWFFTLPAVICSLLFCLAALLLIATEFEVFQSRLPSFQNFFAAQNWLLLAIVLGVTKVLHEFGHGLACKRVGGECHEMGLMLLVFTPCLYCNVSDSWMVRSKWRRAGIGAAGMYVELVLASLCTFLWWFSEPGLLNGICLKVMFVCSVSTLLFNANPLMRYDGYYILSDLLEIPNLRQKAASVLRSQLNAWFLGLPMPVDPFLPRRRLWLFALYSVASALYGWLITFSILWFLYRALEPYGLKLIGQMLAAGMLATLFGIPLWRAIRFFFVPGRAQRVKPLRMAISFSLLTAAIAGGLLLPLPRYVVCSFEIQPRGAASVYVEVPGEIRAIHVRSGPVQPGQAIVQLDNLDARIAEQKLFGQREKLATKIDGIRQAAHTDDGALLELAQTEEALAALDRQLEKRRDEIRRLVVRAPQAGIWLPPPARPHDPPEAKRLASWSGRPLELRNVGAHLDASVLLGRVAEPGKLEAILVVDQAQLDFVSLAQPVDLYLEQFPGRKLRGAIDHISQQELQAAPRNLTAKAGGNLATKTDENGVERPVEVIYQASVPLSDPAGKILLGSRGHAKIHTGYEPLGTRLWRELRRTFHFEM